MKPNICLLSYTTLLMALTHSLTFFSTHNNYRIIFYFSVCSCAEKVNEGKNKTKIITKYFNEIYTHGAAGRGKRTFTNPLAFYPFVILLNIHAMLFVYTIILNNLYYNAFYFIYLHKQTRLKEIFFFLFLFNFFFFFYLIRHCFYYFV